MTHKERKAQFVQFLRDNNVYKEYYDAFIANRKLEVVLFNTERLPARLFFIDTPPVIWISNAFCFDGNGGYNKWSKLSNNWQTLIHTTK